MLSATPEGKDLRVVDGNGLTSHFIWRDARHILAFSEQSSQGCRFYLFEDGGEKTVEALNVLAHYVDHLLKVPGRWSA